eukprot:6680765-Alexandrium_andersonii.AAC.1
MREGRGRGSRARKNMKVLAAGLNGALRNLPDPSGPCPYPEPCPCPWAPWPRPDPCHSCPSPCP